MKRFLSLVLAAVLALCALPAMAESAAPTKLTVLTTSKDDLSADYSMKKVAEKCNVEFEWVYLVEDTAKEKFQIMVNANELPDIILDADVNVGDRVHAYSSYLYDMYLTGNVHFGGTTRHPKTSGSVSVKRGGTINYLKTEFNVREGTAYFNQVDSFLPSITFLADTRLTQAKVFLSITGPLDNMTFTLKSTPEMSQSEIIRLLTLRDAYKAGQANLDAGDLLIVGLQMSFLSEVEDVMRNMLWLDRFTIARGSGSAFDTHDEESNKAIDVYHVEMGKYISDKVMFKYTQQIGGDDTHRFGLQYDMNDRFGLSLEKEAQRFIVGLEARIHF